MTSYNLAELVEATTDVVGDRIALATEQRQLSFNDLGIGVEMGSGLIAAQRSFPL